MRTHVKHITHESKHLWINTIYTGKINCLEKQNLLILAIQFSSNLMRDIEFASKLMKLIYLQIQIILICLKIQ